MRKQLLILVFTVCYSSILNAQDNSGLNLLDQALIYDQEIGINVPWDGSQTSKDIILELDIHDFSNSFLSIKHPNNYSLFVENKLIYRSKNADSVIFNINDLLTSKATSKVELLNSASLLNSENFDIRLIKQRVHFDQEIFKTGAVKNIHHQPERIFYLILFMLIAFVKTFQKREFDFYFSGDFLKSPRLVLEKFLSDSLNPFLIFLSSVFLSVLLIKIIDLGYFKNQFFLNTSIEDFQKWIDFALVVIGVLIYLLIKRFMYYSFTWLKQETRNFSGIWRSYLLTFSNLSFWLFVLCCVPILLIPNFEFRNYFQILFFIFAALNAVGGIMVYSNFKFKKDVITLAAIVTIDFFPIIFLVQLLTF